MLKIGGGGRSQFDELMEGMVQILVGTAVLGVMAALQCRQLDLLGDEVEATVEGVDNPGLQRRRAGTMEQNHGVRLPVGGVAIDVLQSVQWDGLGMRFHGHDAVPVDGRRTLSW